MKMAISKRNICLIFLIICTINLVTIEAQFFSPADGHVYLRLGKRQPQKMITTNDDESNNSNSIADYILNDPKTNIDTKNLLAMILLSKYMNEVNKNNNNNNKFIDKE
jgi:hypothetical protein